MKQKLINKPAAFRFKRFSHKAYSAFNSMHKMVSIGVVAGCVLTFAHATETAAQTAITTSSEKITETELEEVTVTASRVELPVNQTSRLVTIITKEEIQRAPVQSIQDLLNYSANVDVLQRGGHGVQADISIRGGSFDQTAILLNGINLSSPQTGHYSFDIPVNLSDIERIEIIHGPSSVIYGASAFSGGINIITKKEPKHKAYAGIQAGGHSLYGVEAGGTISNKLITSQLSVGYNTSDGYIANSDYDILNLLWQTRIKAENKTNIDIQLGYNDKKYGANTFYSAAYPNQYDKTDGYFASIKAQTGDKLKFIPSVYWNRHNDCFQLIRNDESLVPFNYHRTDVYGSNLNLQYTSGLGITSLGAELRNEGIMSSVLGELMAEPDGKYTKSYNRTNISYVLEHNILINRFSLSASILTNYNTALNGSYKFYPALNASYLLTGNLKVYASWNNAMRMPTFTDLFYTTRTHRGDAGLKPEDSEALELGFKFGNPVIRANISGYYMEGKNLIDWTLQDDGIWQSVNLANVYKKGLEVDATLYVHELLSAFAPSTTLKLAYTRMKQDGSNFSGQMNSNYVLNYLRDKFTAQVNLPIYKEFSLNGNFRWQKRMGSYVAYQGSGTPGIQTPYPAFSTLDLRLNWQHKNLAINLNANNLYNTHYYDLGNIPQAGFWLSGGVSYVFE
ncbi:TonB-dependent receptor plug domain-containing protein [Viscerimonas tarda]